MSVVITGAAGFLGSAIVVSLAEQYDVFAIDNRRPGAALKRAAPSVTWAQADVSDREAMDKAFAQSQAELGSIEFVIHLAAFYHFGNDWRPEYTSTNVEGTRNIVETARRCNAKRLLFASSIAAMAPPPAGGKLTEKSPTAKYFPYAKSKALGERIVLTAGQDLQVIVLRLGGVFSDWCELPPFFSLIRAWTAPGPLSRIIPGKGRTGFPYIHRNDVTEAVRRCLLLSDELGPTETFLVARQGHVSHEEIWICIQNLRKKNAISPIFLSPGLTKKSMRLKLAFEKLMKKDSFEQPWMLDFLDLPWEVDMTATEDKLDWRCSAGMSVLDRLPLIFRRYRNDRNLFLERNVKRNLGMYQYDQ